MTLTGLTDSDGELSKAERNAFLFANSKGAEKLKTSLEKATTSTANKFWNSPDLDATKLGDPIRGKDYLDRIVADLPAKDAEAKKGNEISDQWLIYQVMMLEQRPS